MLFGMFGLGPMELCIIAGLGILLFGKRLPGVARSVGSSIVEFKRGVSGLDDTAKEIERDVRNPVPIQPPKSHPKRVVEEAETTPAEGEEDDQQ